MRACERGDGDWSPGRTDNMQRELGEHVGVGVVSLVSKADNPAWRPSMHVRRKENKGQRPVGQCIGLACWNVVVGLPWLGRQPAKWPNWA